MSKKNNASAIEAANEVLEDLDADLSDLEERVDAQPEAIAADSAQQVEDSIETFESAFKGDPLAARYAQFGEDARNLFDPTDRAAEYVRLGAMGYDLMCAEKQVRPSAYDRARVIKKLETALRLSGVPESLCKPSEILSAFWVVRLDQSSPGNEGESRSFRGDLSSDWFGGNISFTALRSLGRLAHRESKKDEVDVFEYDPGFEAISRSLIARLRRAEISVRQLDALIDHHRNAVKKEAERLARTLMSDAQKQAFDDGKIAKVKEAKFTKLGQLAHTMAEQSINECGQGKEALAQFLVNKSIIPPMGMPTPAQLARSMTPGDAKALVQELMKQYAADPSRIHVFKALLGACKTAMDQMKSAKEEPATVPLSKTA